ncbi:YciI family protein [Paenibacillus herberti]|uniref:YCII-related domain-containing protein n=1 Tax=Paenibacillus herberti TaxID=1619309 RepID=A0A229NX08_9BACL|nr:YciI family protein [Paenibacillus herberti]OXM14472.1 hypothetical protein CGZ75_16140 [Paenibacillus herberti]
MRFMLMVKGTGYSEAGIKPGLEDTAALEAYRHSLLRAGVLVAAEELQPSSRGIRISHLADLEHASPALIERGPFPLEQGLVAGYTLIEVETEDEAVDWALQMPVPKSWNGFELELRRLEDNSGIVKDPKQLAMQADLADQLHMLKKG